MQTSCNNKNDSVGARSGIEIRLTDDPAGFDAINLDVQDVKINLNGDSVNGWISLPSVSKGVYNLLDLVNDRDTLLASSQIPSGRIHQLQLVLGNNNSIVVNGVAQPLETPNALQSGLKLNIQQDVTAGILYTILLDFDAARSVVNTGNNKYILKLVIRTILTPVGGSVAGFVKPPKVITAILAIQGADTVATTFTANSSGYLIKGLVPGNYSIHFLPTDTLYNKEQKDGIIVTAGKVTIVDTVSLTK